MTTALVDTTAIVHLLRHYSPAITWYASQSQRLSLSSTSWLEVMEGTTSKANQLQCKTVLSQFDLLYLAPSDQQWGMQQLERFQFSHHIGKEDCLIASVSYRLQVPLYTHNLKHMQPLLGSLADQPYA